MDPAWITAAVALAAVIAGGIAWIARKAWKAVTTLLDFTDDYYGEKASPGHPARPGVMQRLEGLEVSNAEISKQVHLNSGESMKDVVKRTEGKVNDLQKSLNHLSNKVDGLTGAGP